MKYQYFELAYLRKLLQHHQAVDYPAGSVGQQLVAQAVKVHKPLEKLDTQTARDIRDTFIPGRYQAAMRKLEGIIKLLQQLAEAAPAVLRCPYTPMKQGEST